MLPYRVVQYIYLHTDIKLYKFLEGFQKFYTLLYMIQKFDLLCDPNSKH